MPRILNAVLDYGVFAQPVANYSLTLEISEEWKKFVKILLLEWHAELEKALEKIEKVLEKCKNNTLKYLLLAEKLLLSVHCGEYNASLYHKLREAHRFIPEKARKIVSTALLYFFTHTHNDIPKPRIWSKILATDEPTRVFHLILEAKTLSNSDISNSLHRVYFKAYQIAKNIPHPAGTVTCLTEFAQDLRETHPRHALNVARRAAYELGWYVETPGNMFFVMDTLFKMEQERNEDSLYETAEIIANIGKIPSQYAQLYKRCADFTPNFHVSLYENICPLREYLRARIRNLLLFSKVSGISMSTLSNILNGKTREIKGETLRKIINALNPDGIFHHFPIYNESVKLYIEERFSKAIDEIRQKNFEERKCLFLATYMAWIRKRNFSLLKAFELLRNIREFREHMEKEYETMNFVADMFKAHPYIEGRKEVVMKAIYKMGDEIEEFTHKYLKLSETEKRTLDRFLRNYGRYEGVNFGVKFKGPETVEKFAKKYHLNPSTSFIAYWCEKDGRTRRKLERILSVF